MDLSKIKISAKDISFNKKAISATKGQWFCENYPTIVEGIDVAAKFFKNPFVKAALWLASQAVVLAAGIICSKKKKK